MLDRDEIVEHLDAVLQLPIIKERAYTREYGAHDYPFYVKKANRCPIVLHPDVVADLRQRPINGVDFEDALYHNSNLAEFPVLIPGKEKCGYDLRVRDLASLDELLARIGAIPSGLFSPDTLAEIDDADATLNGISETERRALIQARLGQGCFRDRLMSHWEGKCAVTGADIPELLRASHIKPWRLSNNFERLDPENGLLLTANLDAAFDRNLLSFSDAGAILFSTKLGAAAHHILGIEPRACLTKPLSAKQKSFLELHRRAGGLEVG